MERSRARIEVQYYLYFTSVAKTSDEIGSICTVESRPFEHFFNRLSCHHVLSAHDEALVP
jgi:hypothetical protein